MGKLTIAELDGQTAELLPAKETLFFNSNWAGVYASNTSLALNAGSFFASANSGAYQAISVWQG